MTRCFGGVAMVSSASRRKRSGCVVASISTPPARGRPLGQAGALAHGGFTAARWQRGHRSHAADFASGRPNVPAVQRKYPGCARCCRSRWRPRRRCRNCRTIRCAPRRPRIAHGRWRGLRAHAQCRGTCTGERRQRQRQIDAHRGDPRRPPISNTGAVGAAAIPPEGSATPLQTQPTLGRRPCRRRRRRSPATRRSLNRERHRCRHWRR